MGREETQEPRPLGQTGEQRPIVARQPAIEGPVASAFEGVQESQGDHLTGPEVRLRVFGDRAQLLIDLIDLLYASLLPPVASRNLLLYQSLPITIRYRHAFLRRRKDDPGMGPAARSLTA